MKITETFRSIQGESLYSGWPCFFIRTTGCPLRCRWCDTAYSFYGGEDRAVDALVEEAVSSGTFLVEITGGEPFVQPELPELVQKLLDRGKTVLIETSGGFPVPDGLNRDCRLIVDLKPPGSGMDAWMKPEHFSDLGQRDEIKAVVADRGDFDWSVQKLEEWGVWGRVPVTFSPVYGECDPRDLARWVLDSGFPIRVQVQLHKILFDPLLKGV
ncbi:MAG: radical SAM protein [Nitrospirae bacterium]|nr:radical SAM protein [Nitrospirota bacterium]